MKDYESASPREKSKLMKTAKLTRKTNAKAKGPSALSAQKMREKAHAHMKKHGG